MTKKPPHNDPIIYKRTRDMQRDIVISVLVYILAALILACVFFFQKYG